MKVLTNLEYRKDQAKLQPARLLNIRTPVHSLFLNRGKDIRSYMTNKQRQDRTTRLYPLVFSPFFFQRDHYKKPNPDNIANDVNKAGTREVICLGGHSVAFQECLQSQ